MHNYHHHDSWSNYVDHSNNYKMKVNGVRPNHYYPQQQQLILPDGSTSSMTPSSSTTPTSSSSSSSSSSTNIYCTPQTTQYDIRRCDTNIPQTTTTNIQNTYGQ